MENLGTISNIGLEMSCIKEKRHFIGYEITKEYFDIACERIKQEQAQLTLF